MSALLQKFLNNVNIMNNENNTQGSDDVNDEFDMYADLFEPPTKKMKLSSFNIASTVTRLVIKSTKVAVHAVPLFVEVLCHMKVLQHLELAFNQLFPGSLAALMEGIVQCKHMQHLSITENDMGIQAIDLLSQALVRNEYQQVVLANLTYLDLSTNALDDESLCLFLNRVSNGECNLQHLDLSHNHFGVASSVALTQLIRLNQFQSLLSLYVKTSELVNMGM